MVWAKSRVLLLSGAIAVAVVASANLCEAMSLHCSNTTSGATWELPVDLAKGTADSFPAQITDSEISWEDTKLIRYYDFDRTSGTLTLHVSSSTGGYYRQDHCVLK
jgi:hypothetical protein